MGFPADLETALKRLNAAMDHLEAAVHRRVQQDQVRSNLSEELNILQDDRSRLAVELDGALARSKTLSTANHEVARRLERAGSTMRAILAQTGSLSEGE